MESSKLPNEVGEKNQPTDLGKRGELLYEITKLLAKKHQELQTSNRLFTNDIPPEFDYLSNSGIPDFLNLSKSSPDATDLHERCVDLIPKLNGRLYKTNENKLDINEPIEVEITKQLEKLLVDHAKNDEELKPILDKCINFLKEKDIFYKNLNQVGVVIDLLLYSLRPDTLDQNDTSLCGIASCMGVVIHSNPMAFITAAVELAKNGNTSLVTTEPHKDSSKSDNDIFHILLAAIKNNYTKTGYTKTSFFEIPKGLTRPKEIVKVLNDLGFTNISEFTIIADNAKNEKGSFSLKVLGGVYDDNHKKFASPKDNLGCLMDDLNNNKMAIIHLSADLVKKIKDSEELRTGRLKASLANTIFRIENSHYAFLKKLTLGKNNNNEDVVNITIETHGKSFNKVLSLAVFLDGYRGAITCDPVSPKLQQEHQVETRLE